MGFNLGCVSGGSVELFVGAVSGGAALAGGRETPLAPLAPLLTAPCSLLFAPCSLPSGSSSWASLDEVGIPVRSSAVTRDMIAGEFANP